MHSFYFITAHLHILQFKFLFHISRRELQFQLLKRKMVRHNSLTSEMECHIRDAALKFAFNEKLSLICQ